jgi:hypothetical protein
MENLKDAKCPPHRLGLKLWGRDDQTVQLKCLDCCAIVSVDSRDYYEEVQKMADDDLDDDSCFDDDDDEE